MRLGVFAKTYERPSVDQVFEAAARDGFFVDTILVHAKDRRADGSVCAAGQGVVEFLPFLGRLQYAGYDGPLVVHGIGEREVPTAVSYLRSTLETLSTESSHALY